MLNKIILIVNTIRYLKKSQLYWQLKYRIKKPSYIKTGNYTLDCNFLEFKNCLYQSPKYFENNHFRFLNLQKKFDNIDWNFMSYGKLWNYNLEYFDYLSQENINKDEKLRLLHSFYDFCLENKRVLEPYPVSLRTINCIKFFSIHKIEDRSILNYLHQELEFLKNNLEYHILGNHLLENGFALLMGSVFFEKNEWREIAERLLIKELKEQIHQDGAHFELSPMYHQIIFFRVLELIDWYSTYNKKNQQFLDFVISKAVSMESFLRNITFRNGDIPHFNDSTNGIAYSTEDLLDYFQSLGLESNVIPLGDSGYRSMRNSDFEIKIDVAQLAISYQPGHAHADSLSYIIYYNDKPFIVEQGTSTYEINERRALERSSQAHNTVTLKRENHSEVWSGFRVGRRANTTILNEGANFIKASHDGYYKKYKIIHTRTYQLKYCLEIIDNMSVPSEYESFLHFHFSVTPFIEGNSIKFTENNIIINFEGQKKLNLEPYELAYGYNKYKQAWRAVILFESSLKTIIIEQK